METTGLHYLEAELRSRFASDQAMFDFVEEFCFDGMWYWDLERPEHEWMSAGFWRLFGIDPKGRRHDPAEWQGIIHPADLRTALANLEHHVADPTHPYNQVARYTHADGSTVTVRCRGVAVRDDKGRAVRMFGVHTDITDAVADAEQGGRRDAAVQNEAFLTALIENMSDGVLACDAAGRITVANAAARTATGRTLHGSAISELPQHFELRDPNTNSPVAPEVFPIFRALRGEHIRDEVLTIRLGEGVERLFAVTASPIASRDGGRHGAVVGFRDISELRRAQEAQTRAQRLDALGHLTGGVAHDFNNILGTILGSLELLESRVPRAPEAQMLFDTALKATQHGADLTRQLLRFARHTPRTPDTHSIGTLMENVHQLGRRTIEASIVCELSLETPDLIVRCDRTEFETTILNLLVNARDALRDRDQPHITLSQRRFDDLSGAWIEVAVSDNGIGMSREVRARALEPFFTTKVGEGGTGLGLSAAYGFVQQNGGDISIYSEIGVGTTVRVRLPPAEPLPPVMPSDEFLERGMSRGLRVLLVDDEKALLDVQTAALRQLGCLVMPALDGASALAVLEAGHDIDVLLTDVIMPRGLNGVELARRARALRPKLNVVFTSGYAGSALSSLGELEGPFLQKPCSLADLREVLADITPLPPGGRHDDLQ